MEKYFKFLKKYLVEDKEFVYFFRGASSVKFPNEPSIFRKAIVEKDCYYRMMMNYPSVFKANTHFDNIVNMRHYGCPTRILDISTNPLTSLFMACDDESNHDDRVVYVYKIKKESILTHNSDKVLMLSCLACFSKKEQDEIMRYCENHPNIIDDKVLIDYKSVVMERFLHEIRREFPAFETKIVGKDLLNDYVVFSNEINPRISFQKGSFFIVGLKTKNIDETTFRYVDRFVFTDKEKNEYVNVLYKLGISKGTCYPELEHAADDVKKFVLNIK